MENFQDLFLLPEEAKIARELGFFEPCIAYYQPCPKKTIGEDQKYIFIATGREFGDFAFITNSPKFPNINAPLYDDVIDWFQRVKGYIVESYYYNGGGGSWQVSIINETNDSIEEGIKYKTKKRSTNSCFEIRI